MANSFALNKFYVIIAVRRPKYKSIAFFKEDWKSGLLGFTW
jgi:hypothetical protein